MLASLAFEDTRSLMAAQNTSNQDDQNVVLAEYEKDLVALLQVLEISGDLDDAQTMHDRAMAEEQREEPQALEDHALTCRLGEVPAEGDLASVPQIPNAWTNAGTELRLANPRAEDQLSSLARLMIPLFANEEQIIYRECIACTDYYPLSDVFETDCNHLYCFGCMVEGYESATKYEDMFPVRCCMKEIPVEKAQHIVSADLKKLYEENSTEYLTSNRLYCSDPVCSKFIRPDSINKTTNTGACPECSKVTCSLCKQSSHSGECPEDLNAKAVLNLAKENEWQRCYRCRTVIEISHGCNHMM